MNWLKFVPELLKIVGPVLTDVGNLISAHTVPTAQPTPAQAAETKKATK